MKMRIVLPAVAAVAITAFAVISFARGAEPAPGVVVLDAWARATPPGAKVGAAYVTLENQGDADDRLVSASSPVAQSVMLHETIVENGIAKMRPLDAVGIPAGKVVEMQPGGMHMMLMGLTAPLVEGETVPLTLVFDSGVTFTLDATVAPIGAMEMHRKN
jgi:hypothetical protein